MINDVDLDCIACKEVMKDYGFPKGDDKEMRYQVIVQPMEKIDRISIANAEKCFAAMRLAEK